MMGKGFQEKGRIELNLQDQVGFGEMEGGGLSWQMTNSH
jgi:hypothetical protein